MRVTPIFLQLKLENLEWLGTLGLRSARKNRHGAAKRRARRARVTEAFAGDCVVGQSWPSQGGQKQCLQEPSTTGTHDIGKEKVKSGPGQESSQGPCANDSLGALLRVGN